MTCGPDLRAWLRLHASGNPLSVYASFMAGGETETACGASSHVARTFIGRAALYPAGVRYIGAATMRDTIGHEMMLGASLDNLASFEPGWRLHSTGRLPPDRLRMHHRQQGLRCLAMMALGMADHIERSVRQVERNLVQ